MKKISIIITLFILSTFLLYGCSKENNQVNNDITDDQVKENISNEKPSKISMLFSVTATSPYKEDWKILELIKEKTGIQLDIQPVPSSDYDTKVQIVFNSGNIPDIVSHHFATSEEATSGLLLPISDYEDKLPNFKKYIDDNGFRQDLDNMKSSNGKYYTVIGEAHTKRIQPKQWVIRKDIFEKNNIPIPTTLDDIYTAGVKLKEIYPDSSPITNRFGASNIVSGIAGGFGTLAGNNLDNTMLYDRDTDSWVFAPITDNWKQLLMYVNKLYKNGVLDKEFSTLDSTIYEQKIINGDTFIMYDWCQNIRRYMPEGQKIDPDYDLCVIYPPEGTENNYALARTSPWTMGSVLPATLKDEDKLDTVLKYIDWSFTDEAEKICTFGIEDETYEVDEYGTLHFKDPNVDYIARDGLANIHFCYREHEDFLLGYFKPDKIDVFNKSIEDGCVPMSSPSNPLDSDQIEEIKIYSSTLIDYVSSSMEKFIFGKESFDDWDQFVEDCKQKGCTKLEDNYNKAWKTRK